MDIWNKTDYTLSDSKYSCFTFLFYPHVVLSYLIVISGLLAFITRFWFIWLHTWMGRLYFIFMIWNIGLSLLHHFQRKMRQKVFFFKSMVQMTRWNSGRETI